MNSRVPGTMKHPPDHMGKNVHSSFMHDRPKLERANVRLQESEYNRMLLDNKNKPTTDTRKSMDESQRHNDE